MIISLQKQLNTGCNGLNKRVKEQAEGKKLNAEVTFNLEL